MVRSSDAQGQAATGRPDDYDDGSNGASDELSQHSRNVSRRTGPAETEQDNRIDSPDLGIRGWFRWFWRQLTSMRVALILLLLLAVATIPGSLVPQRTADPNGVIQYEKDHPELFKVLDAFPIQAFDVYSSAWFSAIYILLFVSLIGCVLPRVSHHWKAIRSGPPRTPSRLKRMAGYSEQRITNADASPEERQAFAEHAIAEADTILKSLHYRTDVQQVTVRSGDTEVSVSAERGYLRETGNLVFHIALVGVLISVGIGGIFTFNGQKVIIEGETMLNQLIDYDSATSGTSFSNSMLEPFQMRLDALDVDYITPDDGNVNAIGQVREYRANVTLINPDGSEFNDVIRVNHPLRVHSSPLYLIANGYAPTITVRDDEGTVVFSESVPFIPQDTLMTSLGVVKVPYGLTLNGESTQVGLQGFFYPSKVDLDSGAYASNYPDLTNPFLTLNVFAGDLGIDEGIPQSVYALDTTNMERLAARDLETKPIELVPGQTVDLPNGMGTVSLGEIPRYASFDVMVNPAQQWILVFALLSVAGLLTSLFVPRRRVWVKATQTADGIKLEYAALARGDDPTLEQALDQVKERHRQKL